MIFNALVEIQSVFIESGARTRETRITFDRACDEAGPLSKRHETFPPNPV
ncbi:MAG: hypothetical protein RJA20_1419 [Bacteroidota bacterium]|jgi:hypothetical protein